MDFTKREYLFDALNLVYMATLSANDGHFHFDKELGIDRETNCSSVFPELDGSDVEDVFDALEALVTGVDQFYGSGRFMAKLYLSTDRGMAATAFRNKSTFDLESL